MYPLMGNFYVYSYLLTDISAMKAVVGFQRTTYGLVSGSFPYPISTTLGRLWNTAATTNQAAFVSNTATLTVGVVSSNNYLIVGGGTGANSYQWLYWLIARSMPPGGVMPSVTIGY
ncbi:MAG: hypothetical protein JZD41_02445 [Thermoproteus sp.]|nr:hypothetical protein [Thermoproteus sp.]